jgi:hypothetical protein
MINHVCCRGYGMFTGVVVISLVIIGNTFVLFH